MFYEASHLGHSLCQVPQSRIHSMQDSNDLLQRWLQWKFHTLQKVTLDTAKHMFLQRHLSQKWHDKTNSSADHNDLSQGKMRFFTRLWYTTPAASPTAKKPEMTTGLAPITCRCVTGHHEGSRARAGGSCALRDAWRGLPHGDTGNITQKGVERFPGIHCL